MKFPNTGSRFSGKLAARREGSHHLRGSGRAIAQRRGPLAASAPSVSLGGPRGHPVIADAELLEPEDRVVVAETLTDPAFQATAGP